MVVIAGRATPAKAAVRVGLMDVGQSAPLNVAATRAAMRTGGTLRAKAV
jgi:hypothetical protein